MGNQQLISSLTSNLNNEVDITNKQVTFIEGMFEALTIYQRHNFQLYKVKVVKNPSQTLNVRIIHSINNAQAIKVIEKMQKQLLHIRHPLLIGYHAVAVEQEKPTIKFLVVEENLTPNSMTLRNLMDRIGSNQLLMQFFSDKIYLWRLIIQTLKAIEVLNQHGVSHYDINPNNIVIKFKDQIFYQQDYQIFQTSSQKIFKDPDTITDIIHQFDIQIFDFLNIKELGEIAMNERKVPFNKIVTAYDPPEKISVGQDNITQNCDIWSLGVVINSFRNIKKSIKTHYKVNVIH